VRQNYLLRFLEFLPYFPPYPQGFRSADNSTIDRQMYMPGKSSHNYLDSSLVKEVGILMNLNAEVKTSQKNLFYPSKI
jgi:hypothetical protein